MKGVIHPSVRKLQRWLDGHEDGLDKHLASCERCAERIEALETGVSLQQPLLALLSPPERLEERLRKPIDERLRARSDLALMSEIFGLPIRAVRVMTISGEGET